MNVTQRATSTARLVVGNNNHSPDPNGTEYEQRAWHAANLLATLEAGLPSSKAVIAFLGADAACEMPVLQSVFDDDQDPTVQLALAV